MQETATKLTYYSLGRLNPIVARVTNDGESAEFFAKRGWQDDVDNMVLEANVIVSQAAGEARKPFSAAFISSKFPQTELLSEEGFNQALSDIEDFNTKYDLRQSEIKEMSDFQLGQYIIEFSSKHPKLANYSEVDRIWNALSRISLGSDELEEERSDEQIRDDLETLYSLLRDAADRNDKSVITSLLTMINPQER
jgi:hypothetical protein